MTQVRTKASAADPSWTVLASSITYEPFSPVKTMALGNGLAVANAWDIAGQLSSRRLYAASSGANLSWLSYTYDANGNVGAVRDLLDDANSVYYGYDSNDRLTFTSRELDTPPNEETHAYNAGTNRLASVTDAAGTRSITYDNRGNTSGETRPGGVSVATSYDGYGRLLTYARTGDPAQANPYNGLDERVSVTSGSTTHQFVYDPDGRLIGEYDSTGSAVAETIWLNPEVAGNTNRPFGGDDGVGGYAPLAVATGSGAGAALYWVHGNHLGVPLITTNASGAVASPPAHTMAGFPGQTKTLADIYYNRYRDYDSSLGRYIQADPIGLGGGENPYLYAGANPLRFTDPEGLQVVIPVPRFWPPPIIPWWLYRDGPHGRPGSGSGSSGNPCPDDDDKCDKEYDDNMATCAKLYGSPTGQPLFPYEYGRCAEEAHRVYSDCLAGRHHTRPFDPYLATRGRAPF